jgi:mRNA interferase RelE/StbE
VVESPWQIEFARPAERDLKRLPPSMRSRIALALNGLLRIPRQGDIQKLEGTENEYRLRVGDWRVIFQPDSERRVVVIVAIPHRSDAYRT